MDGQVTLQIPATGEDNGYRFQPMLYTTKDGALKLAHTATPLDDITNFWQEFYTEQPDPALNLPMTYHWEEPNQDNQQGAWFLSETRQKRSRMRGIFLSTNDPEKNKGNVQYLGGSPTAGETIYLETYVYNYRLVPMADDLVVRFSYAPSAPHLRDGDPNLTTIGDVTVPPLTARERKAVSIKWDIESDLGGDEPGAGKPYVIYVTLDPENRVPDEIHELYAEDQKPTTDNKCPISDDGYSAPCGIFCAGNNQGYWPWDNSFMIFCPKNGSEPEETFPLELKLKSESLEVTDTSRSEKYGPWIFDGVEYRLKLAITANRGDKDFRELVFYDNGKAFSMKRSFGLNPGENDFYCLWTPGEPGEHTLMVTIAENEDDPEPGDNTISLDVEVLPFERPAHR